MRHAMAVANEETWKCNKTAEALGLGGLVIFFVPRARSTANCSAEFLRILLRG